MIVSQRAWGKSTFTDYDDVLTKEHVLSYKGRMCTCAMIVRGKRVTFSGKNPDGTLWHATHPPIAVEREAPLMTLLNSLYIRFGVSAEIKEQPQPWTREKAKVAPTREERLEKERQYREEALMAAARRVIERKLFPKTQEEDVNAALAASEEREPDVW